MTVRKGKEGMTMVAKPQLTSIKIFKKVYVKVGKEFNTVRGAQNSQGANLVTET